MLCLSYSYTASAGRGEGDCGTGYSDFSFHIPANEVHDALLGAFSAEVARLEASRV